jgi:tetratricopeptide (TPR) repeat protein
VKDTSRCSVCGNSLIAGRCPTCDTRRWSRFIHRELVLLTVLVGVTVAAFFGTRAVAHSNDALRRRQAAAWFDAAQRASRGGNAEAAVTGLRRAVSKDPENKLYRLALARALAAIRLDEEAKRVLVALRDAQPEDPQSNLQLARLEARGPDADATRRYYQSAVAGLWRPEQAEERRHVRTELIEFLLAHEERARAMSELLVLGANLPQDAGVQAQVGRMFLSAGDPRLALDHFVRALRLNAEHPDALAGAGEAAFERADYRRALRYLNAAPRDDTRVAELREVARLVLDGDPLAPRLRASERRRRLSVAFQQAVQRSVFMIFELTQDYQIIVPLMVANLLSFVISRRYQPIPVYEALLRQDGIHLPTSALREPAGWTAGDVMNANPAFFPADMSVGEAWEAIRIDERRAYLVGAPERLLGRGTVTVESILDGSFAHVHPDHPLDVVLERFAESSGLLPVVNRAAARRVEGVITLDGITRFAKRRREVTRQNPDLGDRPRRFSRD